MTSRMMLRQARRANSRTVPEVARALGVGTSTVYRYEQGRGVQGSTVFRIPQAYGLTPTQAVTWFLLACSEVSDAQE